MKRLFLGLEIDAPWPDQYPNGRLISEKERHITLAFLGNVDSKPLMEALEKIPLPSFSIGPIGFFDQLLVLPEMRPRVVAWHIQWFSVNEALAQYQIRLLDWLESLGYRVDRRPLLSHVTLARAPFQVEEWKGAFVSLPCFIKGLHLYESVGNLHYLSRWEHLLKPAFEEFEHTADIAFTVHAHDYEELYLHAAFALSFKFPLMLPYIKKQPCDNLPDVVRALNQLVAQVDQEQGCPFKAVSYHGEFKDETWEMIVDV